MFEGLGCGGKSAGTVVVGVSRNEVIYAQREALARSGPRHVSARLVVGTRRLGTRSPGSGQYSTSW